MFAVPTKQIPQQFDATHVLAMAYDSLSLSLSHHVVVVVVVVVVAVVVVVLSH